MAWISQMTACTQLILGMSRQLRQLHRYTAALLIVSLQPSRLQQEGDILELLSLSAALSSAQERA